MTVILEVEVAHAIYLNSYLSAARIMFRVDLADRKVVAGKIHIDSQILVICCNCNLSGHNALSVKPFVILHIICVTNCVIFVHRVILISASLHVGS